MLEVVVLNVMCKFWKFPDFLTIRNKLKDIDE